jgi:hypothetical protein
MLFLGRFLLDWPVCLFKTVFSETSTSILFDEVTFYLVWAEANLSSWMKTQKSGINQSMHLTFYTCLFPKCILRQAVENRRTYRLSSVRFCELEQNFIKFPGNISLIDLLYGKIRRLLSLNLWFLIKYTGWSKSLCARDDYNTESYK